MIDELQQQTEHYFEVWQAFVAQRVDHDFFAALKPISVGWKVADKTKYMQHIPELMDVSNRVSNSWLDERWLGGFHTKEALLPENLRHIKLMQRRPGSTDKLGLDHVDFLLPVGTNIEALLAKESGFEWFREKGDLCEWISLRFSDTEAKLRFPDKTSIDAVIKEWQHIKDEITEA
jgi:hypothetical protein